LFFHFSNYSPTNVEHVLEFFLYFQEISTPCSTRVAEQHENIRISETFRRNRQIHLQKWVVNSMKIKKPQGFLDFV
jgi:hypothetical protein